MSITRTSTAPWTSPTPWSCWWPRSSRAQCTDVRVNQVTPALFQKYPTAAHYAQAALAELEQAIYPTGFYHQKAKSLKALCQALVEKYGGQVPASLEELVKLPGIGRKTANVILGNAFGIPGIVVDTHFGRVSQRLGLTPKGPGEDRVRPDGPGAPGALDEIFPPTHLAWTRDLHRQKTRLPRLPLPALLRLRGQARGGQLDTPLDSWHKTEKQGEAKPCRKITAKTGSSPGGDGLAAGCVATLLMGVGGVAAIGTYKWVEGTMEKDYPRPMQETWNAPRSRGKTEPEDRLRAVRRLESKILATTPDAPPSRWN